MNYSSGFQSEQIICGVQLDEEKIVDLKASTRVCKFNINFGQSSGKILRSKHSELFFSEKKMWNSRFFVENVKCMIKYKGLGCLPCK